MSKLGWGSGSGVLLGSGVTPKSESVPGLGPVLSSAFGAALGVWLLEPVFAAAAAALALASARARRSAEFAPPLERPFWGRPSCEDPGGDVSVCDLRGPVVAVAELLFCELPLCDRPL